MLSSGPSLKTILEKFDARWNLDPKHHWVMGEFPAFSGVVPANHEPDFVGTMTRGDMIGLTVLELDTQMPTNLPTFEEGYFEWIDVLESAHFASGTYRVAEFGAGFGRWAARATLAARRKGIRDIKAVLVEAEPKHALWAAEHMLLNGASRDEFVIYDGAVNGNRESVMFAVDCPPGFLPDGVSWYGQAILPGYMGDATNSTVRDYFGKPVYEMHGQWGAIEVDGLLPSDVLAASDIYDLVDMDIQGAEADVVECGLTCLNRQVRRLHIGTHSHEVEERIRKVLSDADWLCLRDFPCQSKIPTPFGDINFGDGVQSWINPRLHSGVPLGMRMKSGWRSLCNSVRS